MAMRQSKSKIFDMCTIVNAMHLMSDISVAPGLITSNGEVWKEQRRFALRHLKDFGFGRSSMEDLILDEVKELVKDFKAKVSEHDGELQMSRAFNLNILNALWKIITGKRLKTDDPVEKKRIKDLAEM